MNQNIGRTLAKHSFVVVVLSLFTTYANAQEKPKEGFEKYEQRLNAVLLTHRTVEKEYVSTIVKGIKDGKIPLNLVNECWLWVKDNRPRTRYPFVYFARVLKLRGDKLRVKIPEFDFSVYSDRFDRDPR